MCLRSAVDTLPWTQPSRHNNVLLVFVFFKVSKVSLDNNSAFIRLSAVRRWNKLLWSGMSTSRNEPGSPLDQALQYCQFVSEAVAVVA